MNEPTSLRREWAIRFVTGIATVPLAFLLDAVLLNLLPARSEGLAIFLAGLTWIVGSMAISLMLIYRRKKSNP